MSTLNRDGTGIYYQVAGASDGRPPLLLTHGYGASVEMWSANVPALSNNRQVITWDIRGHGRSDAPDDPAQYSEALSVGDMLALLDVVGAERGVIGGQSLGGYLSLGFNVRHPDRVAGLVLCDTGPGYRRDEPRLDWNASAERIARNLEQRGLAALGRGTEVTTAPHRSAAGLARAARGILVQRDARVMESLPAIAAPTLVLVGANDTPYLAATDVMAAKIPGATKVVIEDAGHAANVDQPEAFNRAVLAFLDSI